MVRYNASAFWTNWRKNGEDQERITALKILEPGKTIQIDCEKNSDDYKEIIRQIGSERITKNTKERFSRKTREEEQKKIREEQKVRSKKLEDLFSLKLQAFESDIIKNSKNKKMRSKIRRAKNQIELNAFITLLIGMELGILNEQED